MPPEIIALIDKPWLLAAVLAVGAICGMIVERTAEKLNRAERRAYWRGRNAAKRPGSTARSFRQFKAVPLRGTQERIDIDIDAADQLRTVMEADFKPRPLLNKPERRLLGVIEKALEELSPSWRAMGQVSLGEVLWSDDKDAYWAVNSKRVDLLIVDADYQPLHAIEFQGTGHYQPDNFAAARDAVKKEALRRAGIGYVEVVSGDTPTQVKDMVRKLVSRTPAA